MTFPYKIVDLTHTLGPEITSNTGIGGCGFNHEVVRNYSDFEGEYKFKVQKIEMHAGIGTHIDAPSHCYDGAENVDEIPLEKLVNKCFVIDIASKATPQYSLTASDVLEFEKKFQKIGPNSTVLIRTGWGEKHWSNPEAYLNNMHFPSVGIDAAEVLMERNISALGIDVISPDCPEDGFPVHKLLLGQGKIIIENVACLNKMPPVDSYCATLPIKAAACTEAPVRMVGLVPK